MTPERIAGIGFVAVLHVIVIWAIVTGLAQKILKPVPPDPIQMIEIKPHELPPPPKVKPPEVQLPQHQSNVVAPPQIVIRDDAPQTPLVPQPPKQTDQQVSLPQDSAVVSVSGTHTIPPYPALESRLGHQGTVKLRLSISPQGAVIAADIVQSSGFPALDQAALSWVMGHWKYKPAIQGGVPVASTTIAAVVFNLRNAG